MLLRLLRSLGRRLPDAAQPVAPASEMSLLAEGRRAEAAGHLDAAVACYCEHVAAHPRDIEGRIALVNALHDAWRIEECLDACRETLRLAPQNTALFSGYLMFSHYDSELQPDELWARHRRYGDLFPDLAQRLGTELLTKARVRIGYVSRDFHAHAVGYFIEALLAHHDRSRVHVFCYHTGTSVDENTARFAGYVEGWRHLPRETTEGLAERIRADSIDVLIDLAGHTKANHLPVFAQRPAPVQITWLGYPDTTGLAQIDYRLTDSIADPPPEADARHAERLLRIDPPFLCYTPRESPPIAERRAGAPPVFGCFNMMVKVNTPLLDDWAQILHGTPGSRLLLKSRMLDQPDVARRIGRALEERGLSPERWTLRGWSADTYQHLSAYGEVDVALDTYPYHGTTTTCEALWMGVPVVTRIGEVHMARVGATLLESVGLGDLAAGSRSEYISTAIALGQDAARRRTLRGTLRGRMSESALTDGLAFARRFEDAILNALRHR